MRAFQAGRSDLALKGIAKAGSSKPSKPVKLPFSSSHRLILRRRSLIQRRRGHASAARAPLKGTEEEKEAEMKNEEVVEENVMEVEMKKEDEDVNKEEEDEVKKVKVVEEDERKKEGRVG